MRVISGIYKRRRFDVPHSFKARPTTDFAKENLFNVLSNYMDFEDGIRALDLFAGTGSISIELVSRGCDQVISVEKDRDHYAFICKIMQELKTDKCLPIRGDVFKYRKKRTRAVRLYLCRPSLRACRAGNLARSHLREQLAERRRTLRLGTREEKQFRGTSALCGEKGIRERELHDI